MNTCIKKLVMDLISLINIANEIKSSTYISAFTICKCTIHNKSQKLLVYSL